MAISEGALVALVADGVLAEALVIIVLMLLTWVAQLVADQAAAQSPEIQISHGLPLAPVLGVSHEH
jgi:hypothetical protein